MKTHTMYFSYLLKLEKQRSFYFASRLRDMSLDWCLPNFKYYSLTRTLLHIEEPQEYFLQKVHDFFLNQGQICNNLNDVKLMHFSEVCLRPTLFDKKSIGVRNCGILLFNRLRIFVLLFCGRPTLKCWFGWEFLLQRHLWCN